MILNMKEVTQEQFFEFLKEDPRDIIPHHDHPYVTTWETPRRMVVGFSYPGWRNPGDPQKYMLMANLIS